MPDWEMLIDVIERLGAAILLGGLVGLEREVHRQPAGLRTHMMVALGAALFTSASLRLTPGRSPLLDPAVAADVSRVIQGITAGIGFLGAGTILKLTDRLEVKGLTTASSIWLAAAVGTVAGLGLYGLALVGTAFSLIVLAVLRPLEKRFERNRTNRRNDGGSAPE